MPAIAITAPAIPAHYRCLIADIDDLDTGARYHEEREIVRKAVPKRQREFHAGRALARMALHDLGYHEQPILARHRLPVWPEGIRGSISHTDTLAAVAVTTQNVDIGLDLEASGAVDRETVAQVLTRAEMKTCATRDPTRYFCCKEAVFKAIYPRHGSYFEFHDVIVTIIGNRFSAETALPFAERLRLGSGWLCSYEEHIVALFETPAL